MLEASPGAQAVVGMRRVYVPGGVVFSADPDGFAQPVSMPGDLAPNGVVYLIRSSALRDASHAVPATHHAPGHECADVNRHRYGRRLACGGSLVGRKLDRSRAMNRIRDIASYVCPPGIRVRDAIRRIDQTAHLFQVVIDADGRLIGTLTDGDVRRAMLRDLPLNAPVREAMNDSPVFGVLGDDERNRLKLASVRLVEPFLPILDDRRCRSRDFVRIGGAELLSPGPRHGGRFWPASR